MGTNEKDGQTEEFKINAEDLLKKMKELLAEGTIQRVIIKNDKGETLLEVPVTGVLIGVVLLPVYAAIGALAALLTNCTIVVVRKKPA